MTCQDFNSSKEGTFIRCFVNIWIELKWETFLIYSVKFSSQVKRVSFLWWLLKISFEEKRGTILLCFLCFHKDKKILHFKCLFQWLRKINLKKGSKRLKSLKGVKKGVIWFPFLFWILFCIKNCLASSQERQF